MSCLNVAQLFPDGKMIFAHYVFFRFRLERSDSESTSKFTQAFGEHRLLSSMCSLERHEPTL
jgi:hypothetical protein